VRTPANWPSLTSQERGFAVYRGPSVMRGRSPSVPVLGRRAGVWEVRSGAVLHPGREDAACVDVGGDQRPHQWPQSPQLDQERRCDVSQHKQQRSPGNEQPWTPRIHGCWEIRPRHRHAQDAFHALAATLPRQGHRCPNPVDVVPPLPSCADMGVRGCPRPGSCRGAPIPEDEPGPTGRQWIHRTAG
jgi:hypothetical protein